MNHFDHRRNAIAAAWNLTDEIVLVGAGELQEVFGTDQHHRFRAHADYRYLCDDAQPGDVLAFDPKEGWTKFVPALSEDELVWHGGHVRPGTPKDQLGAWLAARNASPVALLGCETPAGNADGALAERLGDALIVARRIKGPDEQGAMRAAAAATQAGFAAAMQAARDGVTERQVEVELEAGFLRAGADRTAFDSIVATGSNGAVLHFTATDRELRNGDLLLVDAGAEFDGYACDCTRSWVIGGAPTDEQKFFHGLVRDIQASAVAACVPGAEYKAIHMASQRQLAQGLIDFGLLRGDVEELVARDAQALFMPHGVGHLLGLAVHDVGGYADGRVPEDRPGLRWLRADLPLETGMTVTVEPGIYFIRTLLENAATREELGDAVDWQRVDTLLDFGGIRIEDSIVVTDGAPEVLTKAVPKDLAV